MLGGHTNRPGSLKEELMSDVCAKAINEFQTVINCNSIENASNTPDFILAEFLGDCLDAFKTASNKREKWYGVALEPGKDNGAPSIQATNSAMVPCWIFQMNKGCPFGVSECPSDSACQVTRHQ